MDIGGERNRDGHDPSIDHECIRVLLSLVTALGHAGVTVPCHVHTTILIGSWMSKSV